MGAVLVWPQSAQARLIPKTCEDAPAKLLCSIHTHRRLANHYRSSLGKKPLPYGWLAERYPARRQRLALYWLRVAARAKHRYLVVRTSSPWSAAWYSGAICVHEHEGAWNSDTGNGYYGGMQFSESSWLANGGGKYAPYAYEASPHDQLLVAYHYWDAGVSGPGRGSWAPWPNTARMCGLL